MIDPTVRRVCFLTTTYPRWPKDHRGCFLRAAALALQRQGIKVRVVTVHAPGARLRETIDGVDVWRIPYAWPFRLELCQRPEGGLPEFWRTARLSRAFVFPLFAALCVGAVAGAHDCQLIHAHWTLAALACRVTARFQRTPYITTVHGSDIYEAASGRWRGLLSRAALRESTSIIAVSQSLADATRGLGMTNTRIHVISNGVDRDFFFPASGPRESLLLYCGSLIRRKGVDVLVDSLPFVRQRHANIRLVIIGDGPEQDCLRQQIERLGLQGCVRFLGSQRQSAVGDWMRRASLFVLPSREEGQGVAALEAIACGTPCVASRVGGIPEYLSEDMGRLVRPDDAPALASAVNGLLDQPIALESMRRRCELFAQTQLDWDSIAGQILSLYERTAT